MKVYFHLGTHLKCTRSVTFILLTIEFFDYLLLFMYLKTGFLTCDVRLAVSFRHLNLEKIGPPERVEKMRKWILQNSHAKTSRTYDIAKILLIKTCKNRLQSNVIWTCSL